MQRKKIFPKDKALDHFNEFYANVFGKQWPSIRHALLSNQKHVAVVNNYSDSEKVIAKLESLGALNIRTLFNLQKQYNAEADEKCKRQKHMKKVAALDQELEQKEQEFISSLNEGENEILKEASDASLEKRLAQAVYDDARLVDPRNLSSTELLQQFIPATRIKGKEDWIPESDHYRCLNFF